MKQGIAQGATVEKLLKDSKGGYWKGKFNRTHRSRAEAVAMHYWNAVMASIYKDDVDESGD